MQIPSNVFKAALARGDAQLGLWLGLANPYSAEVVAGAGFDWLLIDGEHAPNTVPTILAQLQAIAPYPSHPVVRVPWNGPVIVKQVLDLGAQTLLVPYVQNVEEARAAVRAMRYPPEGIRGVAGTTRATRFGRIANYAKLAADELCLLVQIETQDALAQLEKIAAVDGVDGIFIGPADLAASLGIAGELGNPKLIDHRRRHPSHPRLRQAGRHPDARQRLCRALHRARHDLHRGGRRRGHSGARRRETGATVPQAVARACLPDGQSLGLIGQRGRPCAG